MNQGLFKLVWMLNELRKLSNDKKTMLGKFEKMSKRGILSFLSADIKKVENNIRFIEKRIKKIKN